MAPSGGSPPALPPARPPPQGEDGCNPKVACMQPCGMSEATCISQDIVMLRGQAVLLLPPVQGAGGGRPKVAVEELSLAVGSQEAFGLLGPNGAGKTTCLRMMQGRRRAGEGRGTGRDAWRFGLMHAPASHLASCPKLGLWLWLGLGLRARAQAHEEQDTTT